MQPEQAHDAVIRGLCAGSAVPWLVRSIFGGGRSRAAAGSTRIEAFGLTFPNPVGLAAGFDKNGVALPAWAALGFGFVELGTVTALAQKGNPRPRIFRFPEQEALVNRLGFNNQGADRIAGRLSQLKKTSRWPRIPVGINIGKSRLTSLVEAPSDYLHSFHRLYPFADYFAINVSSPNTPGLRGLQEPAALAELLRTLQEANRDKPEPRPLLVKIAPDLGREQLADIIRVVEDEGMAGVIATNTTSDHSPVQEARKYREAQHAEGGLSGAPLEDRSTELVRQLAELTSLPVIASGGVKDGPAALRKIEAGARLVQVYTGLVYRGPALIQEIIDCVAASHQFSSAE